MGEKGNLVDMGEEIFASVAEQGPQLWLDFKEYQLTRAKSMQANVGEPQTGAKDPGAGQPRDSAKG